MKNLTKFLETEIQDATCIEYPYCNSTLNKREFHLKETDTSAFIHDFYLNMDNDEACNAIAIRLPTNQPIQKFLKNRAVICDYLVLLPQKDIFLLLELKGRKTGHAQQQIKHGMCFVEYLISLCNTFHHSISPLVKHKTIRLIAAKPRNRTATTNKGNEHKFYFKDDYIVLWGSSETRLNLKRLLAEYKNLFLSTP